MRTTSTAIIIVLAALATVAPGFAHQEHRAAAPPQHSIIRDARGGAYFIPNALYERYEQLRSRVELLATEIEQQQPDAGEAVAEAGRLQHELETLQQEIEQVEVFVSPVRQYVQTDTYEFDAGPERCLVIVADGIRLETSDDDRIRCELRKSILAEEQPAEDQFAVIHVEHHYGPAEDLVGVTDAQRDADEARFLASPEGLALTDEQRGNRSALIRDIAAHWHRYAAFQGKSVDVLRVKGLDFSEGNEHLTIKVASEGGTGQMSGHWRRDADLTVFVPRGMQVAVLGCQAGVNVHDFDGALLLTTDQSHDRNYQGEFLIDGVTGQLEIHNAPIRVIRRIGGNVTIRAIGEMRNGGTHHADDARRNYVDRSSRTIVEEIAGDLDAEYLDTHLQLREIQGTVRVVNRHGTTELLGGLRFAEDHAHSVQSESGTIRVHATPEMLAARQWYLLSQMGELRVNAPRDVLEQVSFTSGEPWHGFVSVSQGDGADPLQSWYRMQRPGQLLSGQPLPPGIDILTRSGNIELVSSE